MKRRLTTKVLLASLALAPLASMPTTTATAQSVVSPSQDIVLSIGRGELVTVPGNMSDVFIANEGVADVQVKSRSQLYVFGKAGGQTTVYASNAAGTVIWAANIRVGSNIDSIDQMLTLAMPEAKVNVSTMGTNTVLLTGTVAAPEDAAEAERLVQAFTGEGTNVISRLKMATPLQVNLQVKFAEVSRSLVRAIGANLATVDTSSGFQFGVGQGRGAVAQFQPRFFDPVTGQRLTPFGTATGQNFEGDGYTIIDQLESGTTLSGFGGLLGIDIAAALDLAETQGLVTTLSQPNLTALSGETADFLAGGEFPIPQSGGLGTTTIQYKKYGVSLAYTPTVLANGRISLRVRPEVSELTNQGAVQVNGFVIPALTVRRAETTIELGSGQSFMIAGLLSNSANNSLEKAPGLGDVPILGNLFRSTNFQKGETELVIVVTPYLVSPVNANDIKLPTDGFQIPTMTEQTFAFQDNDGVSGASRPVPTARDNEAVAPQVSHNAPEGAPGNELPAMAMATPEAKNRPEIGSAAAKPGFSLN
ncbi:type II and III secretion system protein family protein [Altererythrobacter sp. MF3-039]|uniref:type II and III secretion system protein family protein n=1 Tax=Altererythrobacter sp. MF3-039 TaxID=3252901 RepID=UPI00390C5508